MAREPVFTSTQSHGPSGFFGRRGDDSIRLTVPAGMRFLGCELQTRPEGPASAAYIESQPGPGVTGDLEVKVHWWYDLFSKISYDLVAYAEPASVLRGHIVLFEHVDFQGTFLTLTNEMSDLSTILSTPSGTWNDRVSSIVVVTGSWKLYADSGFATPYLSNGTPIVLGPGHYSDVAVHGIANDSVSSLRVQ